MKLKNFFKFFTNSQARFSIMASRGLYNNLSDEKYIIKSYKNKFGVEPDLAAPSSFNEKIQWLKLYDRKPEYTQMVDKAEAKKYVEGILGERYIIPTLGVWDKFNDINFDELPDQFVLKCTHDSGGLVICRDKSKLDIQKAKKKIEKSLKRNFYWAGREWPYKNVQPRIIAEQYMQENGKDLKHGLTDYKFFCFNGIPKFIYVSCGLENHATARISFYDFDGKELDFHRKDYKQLGEIELPCNFSEMRECAEKLANKVNSPFVRIDLYSINEKVYFSEITFSPCSGMIPFEPESADKEIGEFIDLTKNN